jgi:hypothetical protein
VEIAILPNPSTFPSLPLANTMLSLAFSFYPNDVNILFSPVIWLVHPLSSTHFYPLEEYAYKTSLGSNLGTQRDLGS